MSILGNFINGIAVVLQMGLNAYMWIIIIRALLSWVNPDPYSPVVVFLYNATEPVMRRVRSYLPMRNMGMDVTPIIVLMIIIFLQYAVVESLFDLVRMLKQTG